jgi:hypothetical protein
VNTLITRGLGVNSMPCTRGYGGYIIGLFTSGFYRILRISSRISQIMRLTSKWHPNKTN